MLEKWINSKIKVNLHKNTRCRSSYSHSSSSAAADAAGFDAAGTGSSLLKDPPYKPNQKLFRHASPQQKLRTGTINWFQLTFSLKFSVLFFMRIQAIPHVYVMLCVISLYEICTFLLCTYFWYHGINNNKTLRIGMCVWCTFRVSVEANVLPRGLKPVVPWALKAISSSHLGTVCWACEMEVCGRY